VADAGAAVRRQWPRSKGVAETIRETFGGSFGGSFVAYLANPTLRELPDSPPEVEEATCQYPDSRESESGVPIDFVSVLILLIAFALFGWLRRRAWSTKRAVVKWPGLVLAGLVTLSLGLVAIFAALGFYKLNERHPYSIADIRVAGTPTQIARREHVQMQT